MGFKMSVSFSTNRLQSTIHAVRVTVSRPKRLQTVARFEKNYRMTPLVCDFGIIDVIAKQQEGCQLCEWIIRMIQKRCYLFEISIVFGS